MKFLLDDNTSKEVLNLDEKIINNLFKVLAEALTHSTEKTNEMINGIQGEDATDEDEKFKYLDKIDKVREEG